ncbi:hypothetical protein A3C57_01925 [Candidatus Nomurabacteria bacterium RIFCSPHIGHO2_02_FULL_33_12]|uniref:type II site-specific deoxyribonuclease n=1 Tax=Candidatus Nomurabacteria bacterium RIFCSPLOWO2_01_FULL_33_17 TaxID=1801764 RepID=A0A1F6WN47_9BACT|nr:MAG: hypothetical protein A3C57_01925 [Candidatus Nomurabacteria bacterium RIFCSPHIGHO2_02_FULL_33_12]OGI83321.1 MAG: hypothetical protein A2903_02875 [Candidatus Nomurabacteria bacterium RIFCSPLOWO2_01_FULL_33_17]
MALTKDQKNRISEVVKKIMVSRIESFPSDELKGNRNAPFHDAVLECFKNQFRNLNIETSRLIALTSWMHGLNTSLGSGFESIAHILSGGYKRQFTSEFTLKIKESQSFIIDKILRDLKEGIVEPNLKKENKLLLTFNSKEKEINSLGFSADVFIEKKSEIIAIEVKSVRPNSGEGRGEKQKILFGKAALQMLYPNHKIKFFVGFPFDPTSPKSTGYDKKRFFNYLIEFKKFFAEDEILIASEFWDFLSGSKNTMEEILGVISETVSQIRG